MSAIVCESYKFLCKLRPTASRSAGLKPRQRLEGTPLLKTGQVSFSLYFTPYPKVQNVGSVHDVSQPLNASAC